MKKVPKPLASSLVQFFPFSQPAFIFFSGICLFCFVLFCFFFLSLFDEEREKKMSESEKPSSRWEDCLDIIANIFYAISTQYLPNATTTKKNKKSDRQTDTHTQISSWAKKYNSARVVSFKRKM